MKVGVLGLGEIGTALCDLYKDHNITPIKKDLKIRNSFKELSVLNICIPYGPKFENIVINEIIESNAKLTIIHSTVPIGTTANIKKSLTSYIVNSPVVGSHPFLKDSLESFVKYIGSPDKKAIKLTKDHYAKLGIKYKSYNSFEATETAKLLCTTYYGLCITWHEYMKKVCDENNIDFSLIKEWNIDYNEGYKKFNLEKYNRPILNPPKGKIGGHCVIPNAKLLNKIFPSNLIKEILKLK